MIGLENFFFCLCTQYEFQTLTQLINREIFLLEAELNLLLKSLCVILFLRKRFKHALLNIF